MFLGCFQGDGYSATARTKEELDHIMYEYIKSKFPDEDNIAYMITEIDDEDFSPRNIKSD